MFAGKSKSEGGGYQKQNVDIVPAPKRESTRGKSHQKNVHAF